MIANQIKNIDLLNIIETSKLTGRIGEANLWRNELNKMERLPSRSGRKKRRTNDLDNNQDATSMQEAITDLNSPQPLTVEKTRNRTKAKETVVQTGFIVKKAEVKTSTEMIDNIWTEIKRKNKKPISLLTILLIPETYI